MEYQIDEELEYQIDEEFGYQIEYGNAEKIKRSSIHFF